ncbi:MAG: hypothetical protein HC827_03380 [Cyanobacteria bacterium RM1_2_2]|nr:hypothetical protein [Cyanobacteria bacterium RM1_2_2]
MSSKALIITGMHRSGTSLTAHYLNDCGIYIGDRLTSSDLDQSRGFYSGHHEDREFSDFHKSVLKQKGIDAFLGRRFSLPVQFKLPIRVSAEDRQTALNLVASRADLPQWGWKDPRTSLFLDFWHSVLTDGSYLFLFRHPLAVVDSLIRRGAEKHIVRKPVIGLRVWKLYNQQVLQFWKQHQTVGLLCDIDELIRDPNAVRLYLQEKMNFQLNPVPLDGIFKEQAFRTEYSPEMEQLKDKHPRELADCLSLYEEMRSLSNLKISNPELPVR